MDTFISLPKSTNKDDRLDLSKLILAFLILIIPLSFHSNLLTLLGLRRHQTQWPSPPRVPFLGSLPYITTKDICQQFLKWRSKYGYVVPLLPLLFFSCHCLFLMRSILSWWSSGRFTHCLMCLYLSCFFFCPRGFLQTYFCTQVGYSWRDYHRHRCWDGTRDHDPQWYKFHSSK